MTGRGKIAILAGVIIGGLSPSFVDWQQSPEYRREIVIWYAIAASLVAFGLWDHR